MRPQQLRNGMWMLVNSQGRVLAGPYPNEQDALRHRMQLKGEHRRLSMKGRAPRNGQSSPPPTSTAAS